MTKELWKSLTPKQQWDIQVALRGPDAQDSEPIKWFSTAIIRGEMEHVIRVGGTVNRSLKVVVIPSDYGHSFPRKLWERLPQEVRDNIPLRLFWNSGHFFHHVMEAAGHMNIPVVVVDAEVYWPAVETHNLNEITKVFHDYVSKHPKLFNEEIKEQLAKHKAGGYW